MAGDPDGTDGVAGPAAGDDADVAVGPTTAGEGGVAVGPTTGGEGDVAAVGPAAGGTGGRGGRTRRAFLRASLLVVGGAALGAAVARAPGWFGPHRLPLDGGYAPAGDPDQWSARGRTEVTWHVDTDRPLVALTFDDGPMPDWTPMVLDTLDKHDARATFFTIGQHLSAHADLVRGRYDRHEVANHTWSHSDLAMLDEHHVGDEISRAHDTIAKVTGQHARLLRPPWGHLGGSTLKVADKPGYDVVLWSQKMPEQAYQDDPSGLVTAVVAAARPGSIILAHDTGAPDRLVALRQLGDIIAGLRGKGFQLVTASDLIAAARQAPPAASH